MFHDFFAVVEGWLLFDINDWYCFLLFRYKVCMRFSFIGPPYMYKIRSLKVSIRVVALQ